MSPAATKADLSPDAFTATPPAVLTILVSAALGLLVTLSTFLVIGATSALTYNVVGHVKTVGVIAGGILFYGEVQPCSLFFVVLSTHTDWGAFWEGWGVDVRPGILVQGDTGSLCFAVHCCCAADVRDAPRLPTATCITSMVRAVMP